MCIEFPLVLNLALENPRFGHVESYPMGKRGIVVDGAKKESVSVNEVTHDSRTYFFR